MGIDDRCKYNPDIYSCVQENPSLALAALDQSYLLWLFLIFVLRLAWSGSFAYANQKTVAGMIKAAWATLNGKKSNFDYDKARKLMTGYVTKQADMNTSHISMVLVTVCLLCYYWLMGYSVHAAEVVIFFCVLSLLTFDTSKSTYGAREKGAQSGIAVTLFLVLMSVVWDTLNNVSSENTLLTTVILFMMAWCAITFLASLSSPNKEEADRIGKVSDYVIKAPVVKKKAVAVAGGGGGGPDDGPDDDTPDYYAIDAQYGGYFGPGEFIEPAHANPQGDIGHLVQ